MRRKLAVLMMTLCLLLGGCSKADTNMQQALDLRSALLQAEHCRFSADVTANYGEKAYAFTLDCDCTADGAASMTVTAPETLAGITATVDKSGAQVLFGDTAIGFGKLAGGNLAPMAVAYILADCWRSEYISAAGDTESGVRLTYLMGYDDQELTVDTWLSPDTQRPVRCEIAYEGETLLTADITNFTIE